MPEDDSRLLSVQQVTKRFGGLTALKDYNLVLEGGELLGLIGPNGAGKTTVFNLLSGVLHPTSGSIRFNGRDITTSRPHVNAALGIARTFQNIRLFEELSVIDNVKTAYHMRHGKGLAPTLLQLPSWLRSECEMEERAGQALEIMGIARYRDELARNLPYGDQRKVELARALATGPRLLLLDEPTAGLNPHETGLMMETIARIHREHRLTIFLVEHDMKVIMGVCEKIQVIDQGRTIALGDPDAIKNDARVIEAYLGRPKQGGTRRA
ncbi:MAG: ABC transporter ATP-binding protein [Spirochaetota bacterium]